MFEQRDGPLERRLTTVFIQSCSKTIEPFTESRHQKGALESEEPPEQTGEKRTTGLHGFMHFGFQTNTSKYVFKPVPLQMLPICRAAVQDLLFF